MDHRGSEMRVGLGDTLSGPLGGLAPQNGRILASRGMLSGS
jgi:hypothetical protein